MCPQVLNEGFSYTQPVYDTSVVPIAAAGAAVVPFFAVPRGGLLAVGINKTNRHTNLVQAGRLERDNSLMIDSVSFFFPTTAEAGALATVADKQAIRAGSFRLLFGGDTEFLKGPIAFLPNGGCDATLQTDAALAAASAAESYGNGVSVVQNRFHLNEPLPLANQESISVVFENMDAIVAPTEVCVVLWGTYLRPAR